MYIEALCAIKYKKKQKKMLIVNCKTTQESLSDIKCSNVTESIHCGHVRFHESALSTVVVIYVITECDLSHVLLDISVPIEVGGSNISLISSEIRKP